MRHPSLTNFYNSMARLFINIVIDHWLNGSSSLCKPYTLWLPCYIDFEGYHQRLWAEPARDQRVTWNGRLPGSKYTGNQVIWENRNQSKIYENRITAADPMHGLSLRGTGLCFAASATRRKLIWARWSINFLGEWVGWELVPIEIQCILLIFHTWHMSILSLWQYMYLVVSRFLSHIWTPGSQELCANNTFKGDSMIYCYDLCTMNKITTTATTTTWSQLRNLLLWSVNKVTTIILC